MTLLDINANLHAMANPMEIISGAVAVTISYHAGIITLTFTFVRKAWFMMQI